jgi:Flp pilus assembly protein TadD
MNVPFDRLASFTLRTMRVGLLASVFLGGGGCASLKTMTKDFERKWDDPKSIIAEMDETSKSNRAAESSAEQMAAMNSDECSRKFKLSDEKADDFAGRRLSAAECLLEEGKDADALKHFAALAAEGENAQALQGAGVAGVRLGRYEDAAASLQAAVDLDGTLWRAWNAKGVALDHQGDGEAAQAAFRRAAELNPADGAALNNLGVSLVKAGRREEAIEAFTQALAVEGARDAAEANLRLAYAMDGDYSGAVRALPDAERPVALNNAGVAAATRGDKEEAKRLFAKALDESPHFYAKAYNNLTLLVE